MKKNDLREIKQQQHKKRQQRQRFRITEQAHEPQAPTQGQARFGARHHFLLRKLRFAHFPSPAPPPSAAAPRGHRWPSRCRARPASAREGKRRKGRDPPGPGRPPAAPLSGGAAAPRPPPARPRLPRQQSGAAALPARAPGPRPATLTAAVAFLAAGTMAGRGADMLLPHMHRAAGRPAGHGPAAGGDAGGRRSRWEGRRRAGALCLAVRPWGRRKLRYS